MFLAIVFNHAAIQHTKLAVFVELTAIIFVNTEQY